MGGGSLTFLTTTGGGWDTETALLPLDLVSAPRVGMDPTDVSTAGPGKNNRWSLPLLYLSYSKGQARTRRAAGAKNIASQYARTDIRKESFAIGVAETWNRLPDRVKPESFKKELKKLL